MDIKSENEAVYLKSRVYCAVCYVLLCSLCYGKVMSYVRLVERGGEGSRLVFGYVCMYTGCYRRVGCYCRYGGVLKVELYLCSRDCNECVCSMLYDCLCLYL